MAQSYRHVDASGGLSTPRSSITDGTAYMCLLMEELNSLSRMV